MKTTIYARTVAKPLFFPEQVDIEYRLVDKGTGTTLQSFYKKRGGPFSWDEVKSDFNITEDDARAYEGYFRDGTGAEILGPREVDGDWDGCPK